MLRPNFICAAGIAAAALLSQDSLAIPTLKISHGASTPIEILDNGIGDRLGADGQMLWVGLFGNYNFSVTAAFTKPDAGSAEAPYMSLTSLITGGLRASGPVTLEFTEDGFTGNPLDIATSIGGTFSRPGSGYEFSTWYTDATGTHQLTSVSGTGSPFGGSDTAVLDAFNTPYSLTMKVVINQPALGIGSFNAELESTPSSRNVPDGGATAILLGIGLLGLGAIRQRVK